LFVVVSLIAIFAFHAALPVEAFIAVRRAVPTLLSQQVLIIRALEAKSRILLLRVLSVACLTALTFISTVAFLAVGGAGLAPSGLFVEERAGFALDAHIVSV